MESHNSTFTGGIGFTGLLAVLFIGLKLTDNIDWAWKWVLAPLWIPSVVFVIIVAIGFMMLLGKEIKGLD